MFAAWHEGSAQEVGRVKVLSSGGLFPAATIVRPVGTNMTLVFEVPGGAVQAEAIVRNVKPKGMGVEFTKMGPQARVLLERLLTRVLR